MRQRLLFTLTFVATAALGCGGGGGSGVSGSKKIDELTSEEARDVCRWALEQLPDDASCDGIPITTDWRDQFESECVSEIVAYNTCAATVTQVEACLGAEVQATDICDDDRADPAECAVLDSCGDDTSGVAGTKRLGALTAAEGKVFCDWALAQIPDNATCEGEPIADSFNRDFIAECTSDIASFTNCPATVVQAEACFKAEAANLELCDEDVPDPVECAVINACDEDESI